VRLLVGHDPYYDAAHVGLGGTDVLVTVHDDGSITVALRPGKGRTGWSWGPPVYLTEADQ